MESALNKFANVDGHLGRVILPFPHDAGHNPEVWQYDKLTCRDRINQIADSLTADELCGLEGYLLMTGGSTIETMSFFELHWSALCGHSYRGCFEYLIKYKFRRAQSSFAIIIWNEAVGTGNLSYAFNMPVAKVVDQGSSVEVVSRNGQGFRARRLISAMPLNILDSIHFTPELQSKRTEAIKVGHLNQCVKVHAKIRNKDLRTWSGIDYTTAGLVYAFGDGITPAGNTHIVAFGAVKTHLQPQEVVRETLNAVTKLNRWKYQGSCFTTGTKMSARHGSILFANSDWAVGWRNFIDGAIEEGARVAFEVVDELRKGKLGL
ncbi:hypothetical protein LTR96_011017 [Exophiala xenobiotica]|nr:hypothetical protein LTR92_011014 [Exophiala xenobiotica]KAK5215998.1 hypothetical protein LTR72_010972 [Exophiala xenobiotica]KAK5263586.1 hypothetical protein LTR96_011017 [Exophiala xenobiotica]KAK5285335.1 hypothetical protein LTR14_011028 [Exophiala xenobiotica]KAK5313404.1 hypothetical protein LTR93_010917 [Exophiala xenobiotica]